MNLRRDPLTRGSLLTQVSVNWLLLAVLLIGFAVRIWGVGFDLPQLTDPDEPLKVFLAQRIFKTGDLNPHYFLKPSLFLYINALAYVPFYLIGRLRGLYSSPADIPYPQALDGTIGIGFTADPATFILGRVLTVLIATATIYLVFLVGKEVTKHQDIGLVAALLFALAPIEVRNAQLVATDSYMLFFLMLTVLFAWRVYERGNRSDYLWAGVAIGLTVAGKYNGGLIALIVVVAHLLRCGWRQILDRKLIMAAYAALGAFLLVTPYAVLDSATFLGNVAYEYLHYSAVGHPGGEGNVLGFYLGSLITNLGLIGFLALAGAFLLWQRDRSSSLLLGSFPVAQFLFINLFVVRGERMLMLLTPFIMLFAAITVVKIFDWVQSRNIRPGWAIALTLIVVLSWPAIVIATDGQDRTSVDSRISATEWVETEIPANSKIMVESFSPYFDPELHDVTGIMTLSRRTPERLMSDEYDYVIFSSRMYQRYFDERELYQQEVASYEMLFTELEFVNEFAQEGTIIKIFQVPSQSR